MTERSDLAVRLGRAAALSLVAGTVGGAAVLAGQAIAARSRRYAQPELSLALRATVGRAGAPPLRLVLLGDSSALGVGVERFEETVGGQLAHLLAEGPTGRRVHLSSVGVSGSRSTDLATQVARALLGERPDVAVILIGSNDATALARPTDAAAYLGSAVRRLRQA
ncbi:GDSL family lipase, partial [Micromonospora globispora]